MEPPVRITFDCLPLRTIGRLDIPIDASPQYRARCERIKDAIERHGSFNSYFLLNAECVFRLTNHESIGMVAFHFEGTVLTDPSDTSTKAVDLEVELKGESCEWLTKPATDWLAETVHHAVAVEFDRYIQAGDLQKAIARVEQIQRESNAQGGFLGMYL